MTEKKKKNENELVVVYSATNYETAHIIKGRLESEGIPTVIEGESLGRSIGIAASLGVRVCVRAKDRPAALRLIGSEDISEW